MFYQTGFHHLFRKNSEDLPIKLAYKKVYRSIEIRTKSNRTQKDALCFYLLMKCIQNW